MKKNFIPFLLEREMGTWEHKVKYNLSESGVHPMSVREFLGTEINYPPTNGTPELRAAIAATYTGAAADDVLVTTGAAQANFTSILTILDPGDEIVVMVPNYLQIWGAAKNLNIKVKTFSLKEELGWGFDLDFRFAQRLAGR